MLQALSVANCSFVYLLFATRLLAQGQGIYEADLRRALAEWRYANGIDEKNRQEEDAGSVKKVTTVTTLQEDEQQVLNA